MFYSIPAGYKAVQVRFNDTVVPISTGMTPLTAGMISTAGQRYDDKLLYSPLSTGSGYYATAAQATAAATHYASMTKAAGDSSTSTVKTYNPIIACIVGGYLPSVVSKYWAPIVSDFGVFEAKVENAYCSAVSSLQRRPTEAIMLDILIPVAKEEPSRATVYNATTLNAYLKG